ncbi:hypothetical protein AgCh_013581 [Apium graveolens]
MSSSSNYERYEKYKFNVTEDDHLVCNILLGLQNMIHKPDPSPLTWATKRKRSALNSPSSPGPLHVTNQDNQETLHSPSSPLGYSPNEAHNNIHHSNKRKSKKKKLKDWEEHVEKLKQTKEQLILTLDNVKNYQRTVLEFNIKLKAKRDELNGHIPKQSLNVQTQQLHHQFPIFAQQQQPLEYTIQPSMTLYYPAPFFPSSNGGGIRFINGYSRMDDRALRAADARKRRRLQINEKKNSLGLPHYDPDFERVMSSSSYASVFNTLGGPFKVKNVGSTAVSGSCNLEGGAESSVPHNVVNMAPENIDVDPMIEDIPDHKDEPPRKKKNENIEFGSKHPKAKTVVVEKVICDSEGKGPNGEPVRVGIRTLVDLADFMSEIPADEEWEEMEGSGLAAALKKVTGHWGQLGGVIAEVSDIAFNEIREGNKRIESEQARVTHLKDKLDEARESFRTVESELKEQVKSEKDRANKLEKDLEEVRVELAAKDDLDKEAIIAEFKKSKEYDMAIATAGAPDVPRAWVIAERHVKTDPTAHWGSFVHEFLAAKAAIEHRKGEPEPYDGPTPSFL